ncbi:FAD-dependent oxidoreductase [Streptomyces sp. NPDC050844]|uniref:NAD(P)/FAD-dependent oxidoreductase n=1 Tax=Streptomyces sp. NPDC050844 TaxID=3155790 RepID=UPI0033D643BB
MATTAPAPLTGPVVIVGAGITGATAALTLRAEGYAGELTLVGDEPELPYRRPPLSKEVLSGALPPARTLLRPADSWAEQRVDVRTGTAVTEVCVAERTVLLADGTALPYERLLLATGGRPRRLPGTDGLAGVHHLRNLAEADALRGTLSAGGRVLVVGAGLIGLEVAATARGLGCDVTVVESEPRPLGRVLPGAVADAVARLHRSEGVEIRTGVRLERFERRDGRVVATDDAGGTLTADTVVVAVGMVPETALAERAGLKVDDGIVVDAHGRTSVPDVHAAGDVARGPYGPEGQLCRFEHWFHAQEQGAAVARSLLGSPDPYAPKPWFWTQQYGNNLQVAGAPQDADTLEVDGDPTAPGRLDFAMRAYRDGGRLVGVVCANRPKVFHGLRGELDAAR